MKYKESDVGMIPSHWEVKQLSEIGEIVSGGTPKTKNEEYWNGDIPWITPKDLSGYTDRYIYSGERKITQLGLENSSAKLLPKNTVLFSSRAPIGYVALAGGKMATNQGFKSIICDKRNTYPQFIYYLLKSKKSAIENIAGGSTFKEVSGKVMKEFLVQVPPLIEQKSIANILSTLDEKIETNNQINEKLEEMAQALFKHWFVDFEFPNENGEPYKSSGGEMVESELGIIPIGWNLKSIKDLDVYTSDYVANGSFKTLKDNVTLVEEKGYAVFIRNTDLKNNFSSGMKFVDRHSYEFLAKTKLYGNEVIISNVGDVGSVYLCPDLDTPMTLGNNVILLKSESNSKENNFYYRLFKSDLGQHLISSITGGSVQSKFNKTDFRNLKIIYPKEEIMGKYLEIEYSLERKIQHNNKETSRLVNLRNIILPKLMSGEIRVPLDDDDLEVKS